MVDAYAEAQGSRQLQRGIADGGDKIVAVLQNSVFLQVPADLVRVIAVDGGQEIVRRDEAGGALLQISDRLQQQPGDLVVFHRLQAIAQDAVLDGLLGIGKFRIAADDDDLGLQRLL